MDKQASEGHLKLALNRILDPFNAYGLGVFIPEAIKAIVTECELYHNRMNDISKVDYRFKRSDSA